jgi:hypothetical protein
MAAFQTEWPCSPNDSGSLRWCDAELPRLVPVKNRCLHRLTVHAPPVVFRYHTAVQ